MGTGEGGRAKGDRERPLFQLGLSLFLIIYTASIPRRLPRYVRRGAFGPNKGFLRKPSGPNYKSSRSHASALCDLNLQYAYQCRLKDGVSKQFSPFHQSPPLFLYSLSPLLSFSLSLSLSLSLSFIPSLSHTTTQTAASSHLLTDADADYGAAGSYDTNDDDILVSIPIIRRTGFIRRRYGFVALLKCFIFQNLRVSFD